MPSGGPMNLRYGLDDRPPAGETLLLGLQWLALSLPFVVIVGTVAAGRHFDDPLVRTLYLQKAAFVAGLMVLAQALVGHRLPLVAGPSSALLLGILGTRASADAVYTAAAVCAVVLAVVSAAGLFGALRRLFSPRVTAAVVLLIAFTITPTIVRLLLAGPGGTVAGRLSFAAVFVLALFLAHRVLPVAGRSLLIVAGMAAGGAVYYGLFGAGAADGDFATAATLFSGITSPAFDAGAIVSALFCFIALSLNEVGSMQAIVPQLQPEGMEGRIRRGMTVTGAVNAAAGLLGTIGPVDYSLSPGVIAASGCGSRFPLLPAAALLLLAAFSPAALGIAGAIPQTVVGAILVYSLSGQVAAGMSAAFASGAFAFEDGLVIGLPLIAGTVTALLPESALAEFTPVVRSVAGNGFVVGVVGVLLLDRIFRRPAAGAGRPGA
jgi:xanthine/uracil permease